MLQMWNDEIINQSQNSTQLYKMKTNKLKQIINRVTRATLTILETITLKMRVGGGGVLSLSTFECLSTRVGAPLPYCFFPVITSFTLKHLTNNMKI